MTRPSVIFFGTDGTARANQDLQVYTRTLLFSTSKRGRIIESMYVSIERARIKQNFNVWVHGDGSFVRGSGLYVGELGVGAGHHFYAPKETSVFQFLEGPYRMTVFAKLLGDKQTLNLFSEKLVIDEASAKALEDPECGLYFDWDPDTEKYVSHIDKTRSSRSPENFLRALMPMRDLPSWTSSSDN
jgi:hypothetical protein